MTPTPRPRRASHPRRRQATLLASVSASLTLLAACGGRTEPVTAATAATTGSDASAQGAGGDPADFCATVPSFEIIGAALGEPVSRRQELERGPGWELCEVAGDGVANAQFARITPADMEESLRVANELGAVVSELEVAGLPAVSISGAVSVVVGDSEYSVQAIAADTVGVADSPLATERSATLLGAWLRAQGLA